MKGETVEEIVAFAETMRRFSQRISPKVYGRIVDTCGTGGDKVKTFNVSTAAALIAASAGVTIAKHGNRSVTSKCGSADVLEHFGVNLNLQPQKVERLIEDIGIGFMFAPIFHPAMKKAIAPRKEIGIRTVFNILGPLTNPAGADAQLLGVYDERLVEPLANALALLGVEDAMVIHGREGLDEISTVGETILARVSGKAVHRKCLTCSDFGVPKARIEDLLELDVDGCISVTYQILSGGKLDQDAKRDIALVNASAAIFLGGLAANLKEGVELAKRSVESGATYRKLLALVKGSGGSLENLETLEKRYG
jgi:anthranilate phosphoribosyltransferase/anthranilate synthase/phosphoribosyltransferase